jgi:hypothetical protein
MIDERIVTIDTDGMLTRRRRKMLPDIGMDCWRMILSMSSELTRQLFRQTHKRARSEVSRAVVGDVRSMTLVDKGTFFIRIAYEAAECAWRIACCDSRDGRCRQSDAMRHLCKSMFETEQSMYTFRLGCVSLDVRRQHGTQIVWKLTCGSYAYSWPMDEKLKTVLSERYGRTSALK